jgi:D-alanyl-D-alanine-carboxypeptidase/D-alanyl-D-alanine-endopeptidase
MNGRRPLFLVALLTIILSTTLPIAAQPPAGPAPKKDAQVPIDARAIEKLVQPYLDAELINGLSIGVVKGDQSWTGNYGYLTLESEPLPDDRTIYEIGSATKVFTGILLAHTVETGKVSLDQSIGSLIPELQAANGKVGDSINLLHLSTHMSGLPRLPDNMAPANPADPYADYDRQRLVAFLKGVKPPRGPGVTGEYSNLAVGLLGELLAIRAEQDYENLLKRVITGPLEMNDTSLELDANQTERLAPPHNANRDADSSWNFSAMAGAGAIRSTTADMMRFIRANLDPPQGELGDAIDLAWKQHVAAKGKSFAMGLGWHIARDGQTRWHNGQTGGYHSMLMVNRQLDAGVIVLCNTATGEVDAIGESIIQLIAGLDVKPRAFPKVPDVDAKVVARLAGRYQLVPGFVLTARADGKQLFVQATGQPEIRVFPTSKNRWYYKVVDAKLTFDLPEQGAAASVTLHQNGRDMKASRIEE